VNGPGLLALQLIDIGLDHLAALERRLPERAALDAAGATHRTWRADRARLTALVDAAGVDIARSEHESGVIDTKRTRLEQQMKTIISPREAEALMHQIDRLKADRSSLDDAELEAMEQQSEAEGAISALDDHEPVLLDAIATARAALDDALGHITVDRQALVDRRATAEAALDAADMATYAEQRERFEGVGFVHLDGRRCTGCHLDLSAGEADVVKSSPPEVLPECPHCGRLIVR